MYRYEVRPACAYTEFTHPIDLMRRSVESVYLRVFLCIVNVWPQHFSEVVMRIYVSKSLAQKPVCCVTKTC